MPVKISPIKILSDLGYEMVDIETDEDYLSALREGINTIEAATKGSGDKRSEALREELIRVRKERKQAAPTKGVKITQKKLSPSKFFDKGEQKSSVQKGGPIVKIGNSVTSIVETLKEDQKQDKKQQGWFRKMVERVKRRKKENKLEFKIFDGIKKTATKLLAPMKNAWSEFLGFIGKIILGRILFKILKWMGNKDNQKKLQSIIKFFEDWWPTMLAAYLLFGNAFGRMAVKMGVMVAKFGVKLITQIIPQLIKGLAKMKLGKLLKNIPGGGKFAPLIQGTMMVGSGMLVDKMMTGGDAQDFSGEFDGIQQEFKQGGFVSGPGGVDKVPARLTAGEFVMSKGAVQKYGANTLAAMNAAGGGTNRPTFSGGRGRYNEGGKADPFAGKDISHLGKTGYRMGQFSPEKLIVSQEKFTSKYSEKGGEVIEDYEDFNEMIAAIDTRDLIANQKQLVGEIRKVPGYENINIMEVINRDVNMPLDQYLPILMNSDAQAATFARMDQARALDEEAGLQFINPITMTKKLTEIGAYNGGGLVQNFQGGGLVQNFQGGGQVKGNSANITPRKTATVITPSEKKKVTVVYEEEKQNMANNSNAEQSSQKIPAFNVLLGRSSKKISLLGISV